MNIYQKLHAVMKEVEYIKRDKVVETYKAVTHDMVTAVVRPHFVKHGIIVVPRLVTGQTVDTGRKSAKGSPAIRFEGVYAVSFVNMDDPIDTFTVEAAAHADDYGDKAPGKALSYAVKGVILKVLMIETGENDESRVGPIEEDMSQELADILQTLRDTALEGTAKLQAAWKDLGKTYRVGLQNELDSLKAAAAKADVDIAAVAATEREHATA